MIYKIGDFTTNIPDISTIIAKANCGNFAVEKHNKAAMSKVAKFTVKIAENINWMENQAIIFYSNLFGQPNESGKKDITENLSSQQLLKVQNDFSVEILMVYEEETKLSFMILNSSRLYNQNLGTQKPIGIDHVIYFNPEELLLLFKRTEEIAKQRKYDLIWVKAFEEDSVLKKILQSIGYEQFDFEKQPNDLTQNQVYFKKQIQ
ncbi:MAG: hypothetical protein ABI441_15950 [Flavobacterium sp.]